MATDFDARAADWDADPTKVERAQAVAEAIRRTVPLDGTQRLLEYGAGTGLVTQHLGDAVGAVTLADTSAGMRTVMHDKIAAGQLPATARVWDLDLASQPPPDEEFDLVVTVKALHHIPDVAPVLEAFAALLVDGGRLCVVDLEQEDGAFHGHDPEFEGHHGFARDDLADQLEAAGFAAPRFERCHDMVKDDGVFPLFLATCRRDGGRTA